ncbi:MAG: PQQ-dependent sugar dehydrogenase [Gemmatimonadetes bacterium]|nr:PQQ-dependent sugar dehydrogenase [Gemmatimonadota bacterium]MCC6772265.1 PQQ-dependent sugar dehydrogenase [Gemmatimonadaceae bacterium]
MRRQAPLVPLDVPLGARFGFRSRAVALSALLLATGCASDVTSQEQRSPQLTQSTFDGKLWVPDGFSVREYARVSGVRMMALGPDGAVYASRPRDGEVVRLVDADRDGVAESQVVVVRDLDRPHGLAFRDGWLYVATTGSVVRLRLDPNANMAPLGRPETVATYSAGGGHWTRTVTFGADGAMYVAIGSSCNICEEKSPDRAAVLRFEDGNPKGRIYSRGLRNAVGMAVYPPTGALWVTQHERDNLKPDHQDLPHEEINILRDGGDYGWPYCHGDRVPNPEYDDRARCAATIPPALTMQAHAAPLGMTFLDRATALPADYRGDALVALHGSWNRDVPTGAKVVRIRITDGQPTAVEDFIVGWQDERGRRWGRPVDVMVHADGAVLVSDDQGGVIYRVAR